MYGLAVMLTIPRSTTMSLINKIWIIFSAWNCIIYIIFRLYASVGSLLNPWFLSLLSVFVCCCHYCLWSPILSKDIFLKWRCQAVIEQLPGSYWAVFRQLSGSCQAVVRQLLGSHQAIVRQSSGSHQAIVRQLSGNCMAVFRQLSGSHKF